MFNLDIEHVENEDMGGAVRESDSNSKKGQKRKGKQTVRLDEDRYVISVTVDDATDWRVDIIKA